MKTLQTGLVIVAVIATMNVGVARAGQPHMQSALEHLRAAQAELRMAEHNKAGWRGAAMANCNRAISVVRAAVIAARVTPIRVAISIIIAGRPITIAIVTVPVSSVAIGIGIIIISVRVAPAPRI